MQTAEMSVKRRDDGSLPMTHTDMGELASSPTPCPMTRETLPRIISALTFEPGGAHTPQVRSTDQGAWCHFPIQQILSKGLQVEDPHDHALSRTRGHSE